MRGGRFGGIHGVIVAVDWNGIMGTRQFIDKTTHRHGFWRQFIDTIEDNSSTLFEDNSSTRYYLAIIPKLIK